MTYTVGIDLGTTNSVCCTLINGKFTFLKFAGKDLLPSAILWQEGNLTVGEKARKKSVIYAENFIKSSKTFIGDFEKKWVIEGKNFTPTDVATEILTHIKNEAEKFFNSGEVMAVITVPAYFTANQINETKTAGERAGFNVKQIITEPVAAAIAYGFEDQVNQKIFVIDIGGGTFDVSILKIEGNRYQTLSIDGDKRLGGDNFDDVILEMYLKRIRQTAGIDLSTFEKSELAREDFLQAKQRLVLEAEKKKIELSGIEKIEVDIPNLFTYKGKSYNFSFEMTREQFEEESKILFNKIKRIIKSCLDNAAIAPSTIDKVILVGGTSYLPVLQRYVKDLFGKSPYSDMDLSKLVAMGAAIVADNETDTIQLRDIISHSLGIEIIDERFEKILKKNDPYPISKSKTFTTTIDYQEAVAINIFEGEDERVVDNNEFYGSFNLSNLEKARARVPKIEVTFTFDKSRDLQVTAKDLRTGSQQSKTVKIDKGVKREKPRPTSVDIMFVIDTTGSMEPYIAGVMNTCHKFANTISEKSISFRLGLIGFGDEAIGERPTIYSLTDNVNEFKQNVTKCARTGGGDEPESSFEAVDNGIQQLEYSSNRKVIILVTDAPAHSPAMTGKGRLESQKILNSLQKHSITAYVIGPRIDYYQNFAVSTGGKFFVISDYEKFVNIINEIAVDISSLAVYK